MYYLGSPKSGEGGLA